jgi:phage-related protein
VSWTIHFVNALAKGEVDALPADFQMRFGHITRLIRDFGLPNVHEPYVKHLEGKLWEMRLKGRGGIGRSIYVAVSGQRVMVLRTFVKKTEATPRREMEIAFARLKEVRE